jgi:hypothetical protein
MKTIQRIIVAVILLTIVSLASAAPSGQPPRYYVVAICTGLLSNQCQDVFKQSMNLLLNHAQAGDRVEFLAAPQGNRLASVIVPEGTARARANSREYAGKFSGLIQFLKASATADSRQSAQLRLPQLLDGIARSRQPHGRLTVVVVGSPLYFASNEREAAFDMEKGLTPSDGMVAASVTQSLFGTIERKDQLLSAAIHWLTPSDDWAVGEMHRRAVVRFWTLFIGEQGGTLTTFASDTARVFERAMQAEASPVLAAILDPNDKGLVMRPPPVFQLESAPPIKPHVSFQPAELTKPSLIPPAATSIPVAQPKPGPKVEASINAPPPEAPSHRVVPPTNSTAVSAVPSSTPKVESPGLTKAIAEIPQAPTGHIGIAAVWESTAFASSTADVDLYVAARPGAPEVYWKRAEASDAIYFRDIRHAGPAKGETDWTASWEYVEVKHTRLQDLSIWLNLYETKASVSGIIRIQYNGKTVDKPFRFAANRGNHGADSKLTRRQQSPYWQEIKLREMFAEQ